MLATLEKILMPLQAESKNYLATTYFHRGYEVSLTEIGKLSEFDRVIVGNGMEGTTLYAVHKEAKIFIQNGDSEAQPRTLKFSEMYQEETAKQITEATLTRPNVSTTKTLVLQHKFWIPKVGALTAQISSEVTLISSLV